MKVKICGIKDRKTAQLAIDAGADAIGFVFAESKRQISVSKAKEIIQDLPSHILKIGVFVNETKENVERIFNEVGLTHIQLHGEESPAFCQGLRIPIIKAFRIDTDFDMDQIATYHCEYILVDSPLGPYKGGNGTTFDWHLLFNKHIEQKLILAGGLTIHNVLLACEIVKPVMVDVSSGVETDGKKDEKKIEAFIKTAKGGEI